MYLWFDHFDMDKELIWSKQYWYQRWMLKPWKYARYTITQAGSSKMSLNMWWERMDNFLHSFSASFYSNGQIKLDIWLTLLWSLNTFKSEDLVYVLILYSSFSFADQAITSLLLWPGHRYWWLFGRGVGAQWHVTVIYSEILVLGFWRFSYNTSEHFMCDVFKIRTTSLVS